MCLHLPSGRHLILYFVGDTPSGSQMLHLMYCLSHELTWMQVSCIFPDNLWLHHLNHALKVTFYKLRWSLFLSFFERDRELGYQGSNPESEI